MNKKKILCYIYLYGGLFLLILGMFDWIVETRFGFYSPTMLLGFILLMYGEIKLSIYNIQFKGG